MRRRLAGVSAFGLVLVLLAGGIGWAQTRGADEGDREQAYVEALRREDAAAAERYVALRDARASALADLRKVETQYNNAGPELRAMFVRPLREARKKYAES